MTVKEVAGWSEEELTSLHQSTGWSDRRHSPLRGSLSKYKTLATSSPGTPIHTLTPTPPEAGHDTRVLLQVPVLPSNWLADYNWGCRWWRFNTVYGGVGVCVCACICESVMADVSVCVDVSPAPCFPAMYGKLGFMVVIKTKWITSRMSCKSLDVFNFTAAGTAGRFHARQALKQKMDISVNSTYFVSFQESHEKIDTALMPVC